MIPWTVAHQALLWDFPGKNTGMGCHFLLQGIFLTQGSIEPKSPGSQELAGGFFTSEPPGQPMVIIVNLNLWSIYLFKFDNINLHNNHEKEPFGIKQLGENCKIMSISFAHAVIWEKYFRVRYSE